MFLMPSFKIHRLRESPFQQFRWAPHAAGACQVKPRDYLEEGRIEASGLYAAWSLLRDSGQALRIGDILEDESGGLRICKYVGFEEAHWSLPETPVSGSPEPAAPPGDAPKA
jgi:hypothetical protein